MNPELCDECERPVGVLGNTIQRPNPRQLNEYKQTSLRIQSDNSNRHPPIHSSIEILYDLVVGIGLGQILLQESQVLISRLASFGTGSGLGSGGRSERRFLSIKLGQLGGEVGRECGSFGG
jgi:hypothetical protein